jgi:type II secretory pathway component PulJ
MTEVYTMEEKQRLREEAEALLHKYDELWRQMRAMENDLRKACADYGRATSRWGFSPQHLRTEIFHEQEKAS